ncbi:GMC family oxidoreductase [Amphibiibacter pelophylacis]|uniref:GMC family oxidoreductase n=1 Tax=Amphibiibacter pelophylacis TaxID=1799477 RepID=A0ACC6NZR5_9BURK
MDSAAHFDHIIIGAGTAGCLLANRLSRDPARRVLLIEAGGPDRSPWIHIPVGYLYCIGHPATDWRFQTAAEPGLNGRRLRYPRGRTLGGCSSINGMIYMRGQREDYDGWADATGDDAWRWDNCLPHFIAHEDHWRLQAADPGLTGAALDGFLRAHGQDGEWKVSRQRLRWDILDAYAQACEQAGIAPTPDFNQGSNAGVGYFEVNQHRGWRWNTAKAFLRPARHRRNLTVWTGAHVESLIVAPDSGGGWHCSGVQVRQAQGRTALTAAQGVILSAGAVATPQILQASGLGPGDLLQRLGIPVRQDMPGVGANLQDHLQIRTVFGVSGARTLNTLANSWLGRARIALEYALTRSGPMSMAPSQLGAFACTSGAHVRPNVQFHVQPLSLDAFGEPLHRFPAITASVCNLRPTSRGHIRLRQPGTDHEPEIAPSYLATGEDRQVALESLALVRRIAAQPALAPYAPREIKPGTDLQDEADLLRAIGDIASTIFHPVGTARMGRDGDPQAVLDSRLRVRGVRGLRVVDASVMPTITSGNTNSPVLMLAEKAAGWMLAER